MPIFSPLKSILVCPLCKGPLKSDPARQEWICLADKLAYPIEQGIHIMLEERARVLSLEEWEKWHD